jgi:hypothetical protein
MQVTKVNGKPLPEPIWVDTMNVPRNGSFIFCSRFLDFTGKYMLHCHMMNHEELGMVWVMEVYAGNIAVRAWGWVDRYQSVGEEGTPRTLVVRRLLRSSLSVLPWELARRATLWRQNVQSSR